MAVPKSTTFLKRFPEFECISNNVLNESIAEAGRVCDREVWGDWHSDGVSYLTAHLLATRQMQIGMQIGAPSGQPFGENLRATTYGQEYRRLLRTLPVSGFAI